MDKNKIFKYIVAYQFLITMAIIAFALLSFWKTGSFDDTLKGALIGVLSGIPITMLAEQAQAPQKPTPLINEPLTTATYLQPVIESQTSTVVLQKTVPDSGKDDSDQ